MITSTQNPYFVSGSINIVSGVGNCTSQNNPADSSLEENSGESGTSPSPAYIVSISDEARASFQNNTSGGGNHNESEKPVALAESDSLGKTEEVPEEEYSSPSAPKGIDGEVLSNEEVQLIEDLEQRDAEVRAHEQAHVAAAGGYATGGATYEYEQGPDGKRYAVGGEVGIDTSSESTPQKTIQKMQTVYKAAMAPASPSSQDRRVASTAKQKEAQARQELQQGRAEAREDKEKDTSVNDSDTSEDSSKAIEADADMGLEPCL
jgi:hypothetical protein